MLLYARIKPPKVVMPKLMRFTKEIVGSDQLYTLVYAYGTMFGHPNYEGFSAKDGITAFVFDGDSGKDVLFVAKFDKNSSAKSNLIRSGLSVKDIKDWTFVALDLDKEALKNLTNADWMMDIANKRMENDIEIYPSVPKLIENMNIDIFKESMGPEFSEKVDSLSFLHTFRDELDELHKMCLASNFDDSTTTVSLQLKAKIGSDIGILWSTRVDGAIKIPQLVFKKDPFFSAIMHSNPKENLTFTERLNHKILKNCSYTDLDVKLKSMMEKAHTINERSSGQSSVYVVAEGDSWDVVSIINGRYGNEDVKTVMDYNSGLSALFNSIMFCEKCKCNGKECKCSKCNCNGKECECFLCLPKYACKSQNTYREKTVYFYESQPNKSLNFGQNFNQYICACNDNIIMASSKALIEKTIDNILDNKTQWSLKNDYLCQASLNLKQIAKEVLGKRAGSYTQYDIKKLKPVEVNIKCGNNTCTTYLTFDNASIREFGNLLAQLASNKNAYKEEKTDKN
jgi:hypothetical protein